MFNWTTKETTQGVPAGAYTGIFEGYENVPPNEEKGFGAAYKFIWAITDGTLAGAKASRIVSIPKGQPNPKNALGKLLMALRGKQEPPAEGENLDPKQWVGRKYMLIVQAGPNGGTRVETVAPND